MLRTRILTCAVGLVAGALAVAAIPAAFQDPMPMPQPSAQHEAILAGAGEWEGTITHWMTGQEMSAKATETVEAIGGFWVQAHFECDFMGMPYVGTGCLGYDDAKKKYVGTWIDNMSSYLSVMEGEEDPATKAIVMRWNAPSMTGEMTPHRSETVHTADTYTSTFYMGEGDSSTKVMTIAMKRVAKKPAEAGAK